MIVHMSRKDQLKAFAQHKVACLQKMISEEHILTGVYCNRTWDNIQCWPDTPAGTITYKSCPPYVHGFNTQENASRTCLSDGDWFVPPTFNETKNGWTNYSSCFANTSLPTYQNFDLGVPKVVLDHINEFRLMYNIGYAMSLVCLLIAVAIIIYFRKLQCPRNLIHLNLFLAFMLRALLSTLRENMFVQGLGFSSDVGYINDTLYFKEGVLYREEDVFIDILSVLIRTLSVCKGYISRQQKVATSKEIITAFQYFFQHWECRLFFTLFHYVLTASYIWIFVEGLYLHMLIYVSVFNEKVHILWYMLFGWSFPVPFVVAWAISKLSIDNTLCWNTSINSPGLIWIMKGPVMASIIINFLFFISIVRVLFTKLTSSHCPDSKRDRYRRLAKSTLVLIPIFGVYYIMFTFPMDKLGDTASFVMLFIEMFFNSYQGVIIAFLLCFINAEVRSEIRKAWNRQRIRRSSASSFSNSMYRTYRLSTDTRASESYNVGAFLRKYRIGIKKNTSASDLEESCPLGLGNRDYEPVQNGIPTITENNVYLHGKECDNDKLNNDSKSLNVTTRDQELESDKINDNPNSLNQFPHDKNKETDSGKLNGDPTCNGIELKINILTIEYSSNDKISKNVSNVDIEALQDGSCINETSYINSNGSEAIQNNVVDYGGDTSPDQETVFLVS